MEIINLGGYRGSGSLVYTGRPEGEKVRQKLRLDKLDEAGEEIEVIIPEDTIMIASSFFLGMFGPSIRKFGEEGFRARYSFRGPSNIEKTVRQGIREALKTESPLSAFLH